MEDPDRDAIEMDEEVVARERADQEAGARAKLMAHPHTQLRDIQASLSSPAATQADVNTRLAYLQAAVRKLVQIILTHTPAPEEPHGEVEQRQQQSSEGSQQSQS